MKASATLLATTAVLGFATASLAADPKAEALAKNNGCLACHSADKKLVGPSFKEIAAKYRNDKGAGANLVKKVKAGGKGVWGDVPMPPNAHVKDEDIKTLVQWILTMK